MAAAPILPIRLRTPLGEGALLFGSMSAREELGRLYEFNVQAVSEDRTIKPVDLLGKPATVSLQLTDNSWRHFDGIVAAMAMEGAARHHHLYQYRLVLRPWLWLLTRRADTRIFQAMTVVDILKKVFEPFNPSYEIKLKGSFPTYDYCVQYRETDFNFVSRLMEQEGIYYHFRHAEGRHTLVLVNTPDGHETCPVQHHFRYRASADGLLDEEFVTHWRAGRQVQPGKVVMTDYNFETPAVSLQVTAKTERDTSSPKLEVYDYPGDYPDTGAGNRYAGLRQQEWDARASWAEGGGAARTLAAGHRFELAEHPQAGQDAEYLLISTRIELGLSGYESGGEGELHCRCSFTAQHHAEVFRPERVTPRPVVNGLHTAVVVGPAGEEIYTDEHGRVKVHFHWDRLGQKNQDDSCWMRVSQPWAGQGWGGISIPRIGQEVIVDFIEGNPDRPIITGRVYNAAQMPPYALPANSAVSGMKSQTHKGAGYNEMSMDDTAGKEKITVHAQFDMGTTVEHDDTQTIHNDRTIKVDGKHTETITKDTKIVIESGTFVHDVAGNTASYHVSGDLTEKFDAKHTQTVGADQTLTLKAKRTTDITADDTLNVGANRHETVKAKRTTDITGDDTLTVNGKIDTTAKGGASITSPQKITLTVGASTVELVPGSLTLTCGPSTIKIDPSGVSITAPKISLNG